LKNYLDYKISMALFGLPDTQPIQDAAQFLADLWAAKDKFSPSKLSNADAASVKRFSEGNFPYLAGYSPPLQELKRRIKQVGKTDLSVLVIGETGTGKENVACYLHEFSQRREKPLLALNCAGLTETFLRSELFGHVKGAYTGADTPKMGAVELAEGGTLFLDEVAEMPLSVQAALLRFLQNRRYVRLGETVEKTADVRVIAATQPDLEARMQDGRFRRDLYFRLAEVTITTPALREVPDDIQHVTDHILFAHRGTVSSTEFRRTRQYFTQGMGILRTHPWPGNVRELSSLVRRKLVLDDDVLAELGRGQNTKVPSSQIPVSPPYLASIRPIDDILREYVEQAFQHRGALTQQQLAKKLGKSVNTIKKILRP
jgi:DNA-binding NtrC family response regulator